MSQEVAAELVNSLLETAYSGAVPAAVHSVMGDESPERLLVEGKLCVGFSTNGGPANVFMMSVEPETSEDWRAHMTNAWPEAGAFFSTHAEQDQYLVEVTESEHVLLYGSRHQLQTDTDGQKVISRFVNLTTGDTGRLTAHEAAPTDILSGSMADQVASLVGSGAEGMWWVRWVGGEVQGVMWLAMHPGRTGMDKVVHGLGSGEVAVQVKALADERWLHPNMYIVESRADGDQRVSSWLWWAVEASEDLPAAFEGGGTPSASEYADLLVYALLDDEKSGARRLIEETIYPGISEGYAGRPEQREALIRLWRGVMARFTDLPPFGRMAVLEDVGRFAALRTLEMSAFHLAVARYLGSHPDTEIPEGTLEVPVPERLLSSNASSIQDEASVLADKLGPLAEWLEETGGIGDFTTESPDVEIIRQNLEMSGSGRFTAARGKLHELLLQLGPLGYDDDPALANLEDIDLEADPADDLLSQALLEDDS